MDSISKNIASRRGLSKAILVIKEKIVCFKESKKLFWLPQIDNGLDAYLNIRKCFFLTKGALSPQFVYVLRKLLL